MRVLNDLNNRISKIIKKHSFLDATNISEILKNLEDSGQRLDDYLVKSGLLTDTQQSIVLSELVGVKITNIDLIQMDDSVVSSVSLSFLTDHHILPLRADYVDGIKVYTVAIGEALDSNALLTAKAIYGKDANIVYSSMPKLLNAFSVCTTRSEVTDAVDEYTQDKSYALEDEESEDASVSTAPSVKLAESMLREAIASKASDIHIEPYENEVRVRFRIDGVLHERTSFSTKMYPAVVTRFKIISSLNITERRIPQDGRFAISFNDQVYDFRLSTLPTVHGEKIVIRILDNSSFGLSLKELGFSKQAISEIMPVLKTPHGIILLTGPTGSGKSTTLYSFIREVNGPDVNIVSVEDPVEYSMQGVNQVQVNTKVNMTFASALRSILRQDPNIIIIGEIRDEETAHIAIRSAITGHLVFSTLHTNDAPSALSRLTDMGVEPYLEADAIEMIIAQRLVRRLCPECKKKVTTTDIQNKTLGLSESINIYEPCGCPACHNTGYKGRIAIYEILKVNNDIKELIATRRTGEDLTTYLANHNYVDLKKACIERIIEGVTSYSELFTIAQESNDPIKYVTQKDALKKTDIIDTKEKKTTPKKKSTSSTSSKKASSTKSKTSTSSKEKTLKKISTSDTSSK